MNLLNSWTSDANASASPALGPVSDALWQAPRPTVDNAVTVGEFSPPRALVFEMENVLYDGTSWERWLWQLMTRLGWQRDFRSFSSIWHRGYLHDVHCGCREFAEALRAFLTDSGLTPGQIDEVEAASSARRREFTETIRPLPSVVKTMNRLATASVVLCVLSNSEASADELDARIDKLGLKGRFRFVCSSRDLQHAKPEPACYQAALDRLKLPASEVAMVACLHDDLAGAAAVGLRTFAVNAECGVKADFCLRRFDDLLSTCAPSVAASLAE
jgi:HAD superfamily hydrolase (TIGR01509 family)